MATFAELRERFSDDVYKRGKQFERVCKWFLETDPRYSERLVNVWLWDDWPGRRGPDCGIDLVAEDRDGRTWAIQAKCYDPKYPVTRKDMDRFLTESIHKDTNHRLLIASTNKVGTNARKAIRNQNTVIPVSQLLLHDLESAPVVWPSDPARLRGGWPRKPVKRWPHQTQAINNVTKNLDKRGQMISACGTGKTLAALWISERLEAKRTLVLLPSLTLLSQTVSEWLANAKEPFAYLPVCSDQTVSRGNDSAVVFTSDLEYPVTTDPDDIATFLRRRCRQVVFSTYQSSQRIAEAQTRSRVPGFDLVIADEAHRCAGKVSSAYGTVLDDESIRAKKRLFMTATPRTYTARVQKKAREADIEIASMDDETVFGPVVHQLNFGEAIEKGLLSDYQVVVVGADNSRYKQMVDKRRIVKADRDLQTDAETPPLWGCTQRPRVRAGPATTVRPRRGGFPPASAGPGPRPACPGPRSGRPTRPSHGAGARWRQRRSRCQSPGSSTSGGRPDVPEGRGTTEWCCSYLLLRLPTPRTCPGVDKLVVRLLPQGRPADQPTDSGSTLHRFISVVCHTL